MEFTNGEPFDNSEPEFLVHYEDDPYPPSMTEEYDYEDYDEFLSRHGPVFSPYSFDEILENCIIPNATDGLKMIGPVVFWCVVFRILTQCFTNFPPWLKHSTSVGCGIIVALKFFAWNTLYLFIFTFLSYVVLAFSHNFVQILRGPLSIVVCTSFNMICELFFANPIEWHQIRGAQMILTMKLISIAFDMDEDIKKSQEKQAEIDDSPAEEIVKPAETNMSRKNRRKKWSDKRKEPEEPPKNTEIELLLSEMPSIFEYFGYALCPGTIVFGPWFSYQDYMNIFREPKWNFAWLLKVLFSMGFGFMFLTLSACWINWFIPKDESKWISAYRDAMSFRASHYFVSFISMATAVASGFGSVANTARWEVDIAQPHNIEVPRSLVDVVVSWNIPMHKWLKKYVFKRTIAYGKLTAVMSTFFASTFLHGLNFQLGAVLLSLGFFSFVEDKFRSRLSLMFDASIGARRDDNDQYRRHREASFMVMLINTGFGIFTVGHLMYLGVMFDQSDIQTEGYHWTHTIAKWNDLGFFSHVVFAVLFIFSFIF